LISILRTIVAGAVAVLLFPGSISDRGAFRRPVDSPVLFAFYPASDWVYLMFPEAALPYGRLIKTVSLAYRVDPHLVAAVIAAESRFDPTVVSRKGAVGLMQVLPLSSEEWDRLLVPSYNLKAGIRHLKSLLEIFNGDLEKSLAAYNCGEGRIQRTGAVPATGETGVFLRNVLDYYYRFWSSTPVPGLPLHAAEKDQAGLPR
jgi:hypothetical protein